MSRVSSILIVVGVVCVIGEMFQSAEMLLLLLMFVWGVWHGLCLGDGVGVGIGAGVAHISLLSSSSSVGIGADAALCSLLTSSSSLVQLPHDMQW